MGLNATNILAAATRFSNFTAAFGVLSNVLAFGIDAVEQMSPGTAGASKFNAVLTGAKNFLVGLGNDVALVEQIVPTISAGINTMVDAYKGRIVQVTNPQTGQTQWVQAAAPSPTPTATP